MSGYLKNNLKFFSVIFSAAFLVYAKSSAAWTSAHLFNVNVTVDLAESGPSTVTTDARFVVEAGYFHGFDFSALEGATLDKTASTAYLDDQRALNVEFKRVRGGKIRVLFADEKYVRGSGVTFRIVHHIDFAESGALRPFKGRTRFDWTPLIWDVGLDNMRVQIRLPEERGPIDAKLDPTTAEDYVATVSPFQVSVIKFRPVKWYPMRVLMDFNAGIVRVSDADAQNSEDPEAPAPLATAAISPPTPPPGPSPYSLVLPAILCLAAFPASILKARHVRNAFYTLGLTPRFVMLPHTSLRLRGALCLCAAAFGGALQVKGYAAAGTLPFLITAALFLIRKAGTADKPRAGGTWRPMTQQDISRYGELLAAYRKNRSSIFDITTLKGQAAFILFLSGLIYAAFFTYLEKTELSLLTVIDGLILAAPAWFSHIRAELPVDSTLEGFGLLRKWQKSFAKLVGKKTGEAAPVLHVREDASGPVEVRLRAALPIDGLHIIEAAAEHFTAGTLHRVRTVFVLRMEPGAPITRKLAACPHAAEHHLTPDLQEETIVLRNRRGKNASGLAPLRIALHRLGA